MPAEENTSILCANIALAKHGMMLKRVSSKCNQRGGLPYHVLKEGECNLIINIKLGDLQHRPPFASHFVAWDGKIIWDHPDYVKVNITSGRATVE